MLETVSLGDLYIFYKYNLFSYLILHFWVRDHFKVILLLLFISECISVLCRKKFGPYLGNSDNNYFRYVCLFKTIQIIYKTLFVSLQPEKLIRGSVSGAFVWDFLFRKRKKGKKDTRVTIYNLFNVQEG